MGGYGIYELASQEEIIDWAQRFAEVHRLHWPAWEGEIVIQQLHNFSMPG